jgi:hypothetical protein
VHSVCDVRQIVIHIAEPLVPDPRPFQFHFDITKLKMYKSIGNDQIPAELIQAGDETLLSGIHTLINSIRNKEELPDQWKKYIVVQIYKKGDKTVCKNYRGILLLSTSYRILSNILLSRLSPYTDEVIGDNQCGF